VSNDPLQTLDSFSTPAGEGSFYSLPKLEAAGVGPISRLPVSIRLVLESVLRNCDGKRITEEHVRQLANWGATDERTDEIPFVVARIVLQDFTGVPLLVDLAAMRSAVERMDKDPKVIEPLVPVDLVVDHSVQVDYSSTGASFERNMAMEFKRNRERYEFLKWGMQAFDAFKVVPSGIGIVHQVNLEYLAQCVLQKDGVYYPDTLVGTDSHTTMINGLGVVGWGVGGIEAEAGMLGQPVYFLTPDVVGVELTGALHEGVTATDMVLRVTEMLRAHGVVGKFVEFFGPGAESLSLPDRATISNMAPEYGATMGFFPYDERSSEYMRLTGREEAHIETVENYFKAQGLFGIPKAGEIDYSVSLSLDLDVIEPSVSGPKRPQDRIDLKSLKSRFVELFQAPTADSGYGKAADELNKVFPSSVGLPDDEAHGSNGGGDQSDEALDDGWDNDTSIESLDEMVANRPTPDLLQLEDLTDQERVDVDLHHGDVLIAAITSCTNTSNPSVMLAAGLVAKKAVEKGLTVNPAVKTSLAPGSRVVSDYLDQTGLQPYLDELGFNLVGYGCTTCIGNSGPLDAGLEATSPPSPSAPPSRARTSTSRTSGRRSTKSASCCRARSTPRLSAASTATSPSRTRCGMRSRARPALSTSGTASPPTCRSRRSSKTFRWSRLRCSQLLAPARSRYSATPSRPTTSRRPARSRKPRPPVASSTSTASRRSTSTPMARAAATTAS
jgi:aconitate hydratase